MQYMLNLIEEQLKHSRVLSIKKIHQYNPSQKLNRYIKITAKQRPVCDDSELSLGYTKPYILCCMVEKQSSHCLQPNVCRPEMQEQNCWQDVL